MKYAILILSIFTSSTFASCLVSIENGEVILWKHTEGTNDSTDHKFLTSKDSEHVVSLFGDKNKLRLIFNDGVFTAFDHWDKDVKVWAQLSKAQKDAIFYLQEKFDVTEK